MNDGVMFSHLLAGAKPDVELTVEYSNELSTGFHPVYKDDPDFDTYLSAREAENNSLSPNDLLDGNFERRFVDDPRPNANEGDSGCFLAGTSISI